MAPRETLWGTCRWRVQPEHVLFYYTLWVCLCGDLGECGKDILPLKGAGKSFIPWRHWINCVLCAHVLAPNHYMKWTVEFPTCDIRVAPKKFQILKHFWFWIFGLELLNPYWQTITSRTNVLNCDTTTEKQYESWQVKVILHGQIFIYLYFK